MLGLIRRWMRGVLEAPVGTRSLYVRRGLRGLYRRAVDRLPFSVEKRLQAALSEIHPNTLSWHAGVAQWAEVQVASFVGDEVEATENELQDQHRSLMADLDLEFRSRWRDSWPRVLIHLPPPEKALAWASNARNMLDCLRYMGVDAEALDWDAPICTSLEKHRPNILLTIWHEDYLRRIDWKAVREYRTGSRLLVGINAPEEELYGADVVRDLISWSKGVDASFFFKDRPRAYVETSYHRFWDAGYEVLALEYGANPLLYYPVSGAPVDLDYCFLGSLHRDKWSRYLSYFGPILKRHPGFLIGPGWPTGPKKTLPPETHRFLYGRAAVGLNLHHETQLRLPVELNERTYNLASAGIPQVIDSPKLLSQRFDDGMFFRAESASDFYRQFERALGDRLEAKKRALAAHAHVLKNHTMFHRLTEFLMDVKGVTKKG